MGPDLAQKIDGRTFAIGARHRNHDFWLLGVKPSARLGQGEPGFGHINDLNRQTLRQIMSQDGDRPIGDRTRNIVTAIGLDTLQSSKNEAGFHFAAVGCNARHGGVWKSRRNIRKKVS